MNTFLEFHSFIKLDKSINATFITLIFKKGAKEMKEGLFANKFGSCVLFKILFKVLANRMSVAVNKIIIKTQNAFMMGTKF